MSRDKNTIVIGSRESKLAVIQSEMIMAQIRSRHPELKVELITMKTTGDKILDRRLDQIGGKGLFVKELDQALMDGRIDLSVHSLKDMPMEVSPGLPLVAFSKREDPRDVLVFPEGMEPVEGAGIPDLSKPFGCSSRRRSLQLAKIYPGSRVESVRGNVLTRMSKLESGTFCALVLARAGLVRLGLAGRIGRVFSPEEMIPAAGQGILAIQGRAGEPHDYLDAVEDADSRAAALAERAFVRELDGGCSSPIAAYARISGSELLLDGLYYDEDQERSFIGRDSGPVEAAEELGRRLADRLRKEAKA